jgi:hypothetical protein
LEGKLKDDCKNNQVHDKSPFLTDRQSPHTTIHSAVHFFCRRLLLWNVRTHCWLTFKQKKGELTNKMPSLNK